MNKGRDMVYMKRKIALIFVFFFTLKINFLESTSLITTAPGGDPGQGYQGGAWTITNNEPIRGRVLLKNGLTVNPGGVGIWDADGVVNGGISTLAANHFLSLQTDLRMGSTASFTASTVNFDAERKTIFLGSDITLNTGGSNRYFSITPTSSLTINGRGHSLSVINENVGTFQYVKFQGQATNGVPTAAHCLKFENMTLLLNNGNQSTFVTFDLIRQLVFKNMTLWEKGNGDVITVPGRVGNILIQGDVYLRSKPGAIVDFGATKVIIDKNSTLHVEQGVVLTNLGALTMADATATLHLNGCKWYVGSYGGIQGRTITKGRLVFENKVQLFNTYYYIQGGGIISGSINTDMSQGLILGDGTAANDVDVRVIGGTYVIVNGCMDYRHS